MTYPSLALAASLLAAGTATATTGHTTLPPLRLSYDSAFHGLPPTTDPAPVDWSRSNARVGALRGHAGHLRSERDAPDLSPGTAPAAPAGTRKP